MPDDNIIKNSYRRDFVVYWENTGTDAYGQVTVASPREIKVRIEEDYEETLDAQGNVVGSDLLMNVGEELVVGSLVWIGKLADLPSPVPELYQITEYEETPDIRGRKFDRNIKLIRHGDRNPTLT